MKRTGFAVLLGSLILTLALGCGGRRGGKPRAGSNRAARTAADGGAPAVTFAPTLRWRMPLKGRLRVLGVDKGVVLVMSRDKGDRASGRRLAGLSDRDGKLLWQQAKTVRFFERSTSWSTSHAVVQGVVAYAKPTKKVEALDVLTGAKRWLLPGSAGVAALGSDLVVADREVVSLVQAASGTVKLRMALSDPRSGAPGDGLMDRLHFGPMVSRLPGGVIVTRRHGGALQALDGATLTGRWRFDPTEALPDRPARTVAGDRAVLVSVHLPPRDERTRLSGWAREGEGGAPAWSVDLPGSFTRPLIFTTEAHVVGISRTASRRSVLWRVDRATGKLVDSRPFAAPAFCFVGGGVIACQRKDGLAAHALETLKQAWQYAPPAGKVVRTVRHADGIVVLEVGDQVVALRLATGQQAFAVGASVEKSPFRILQVLGVAGTTLVLQVRHLEGSAWGDRILVVGLDLGSGKVVMNVRVGRYPRPAPPGKPEATLDPAEIPVALVRAAGDRPDRIVTVADGPLQVIAVPSGRVLASRILPGDKDEPFVLVRLVGGRMLVRRAHALHALDLATDTVAWQASLWHRKVLSATADHVILQGEKGEVEVQPRPAPNPLEPGLRRVSKDACTLGHVSAKRWYCQTATDLLVIDPTTGETAAKLPRVALLPQGDQLLAAQVLTQKQPGRDAWVALDPASGKERWRQAAPDSDAAASGLPAPFVRDMPEPPRWAAAHADLFLVTSADGRCLRAVDQMTGALRWKTCVGELDGPPLVFQGYLLLAARPAEGPKGKLADAQVLLALDLATGKAREVYRPEAGMQIVVGSAEVVGNVLFASLQPVKGPYTRNEVIALALTK